jgi:hypothetical protein
MDGHDYNNLRVIYEMSPDDVSARHLLGGMSLVDNRQPVTDDSMQYNKTVKADALKWCEEEFLILILSQSQSDCTAYVHTARIICMTLLREN